MHRPITSTTVSMTSDSARLLDDHGLAVAGFRAVGTMARCWTVGALCVVAGFTMLPLVWITSSETCRSFADGIAALRSRLNGSYYPAKAALAVIVTEHIARRQRR